MGIGIFEVQTLHGASKNSLLKGTSGTNNRLLSSLVTGLLPCSVNTNAALSSLLETTFSLDFVFVKYRDHLWFLIMLYL